MANIGEEIEVVTIPEPAVAPSEIPDTLPSEEEVPA